MKLNQKPSAKIKIGISSCLLGHPVRYDGKHKYHGFVVNKLGQYFDFVPVCPETGIGMPVPRPPIQLVREGSLIRVLDIQTHQHDYTDSLQKYPEDIEHILESISGYVLKKNSPSCGLYSVKIYSPENNQTPLAEDEAGQFVKSLQAKYPLLPLEEEGRLASPDLRKNFIRRTRIYSQWQLLARYGVQPADLKRFHLRIEMQISDFSPRKVKQLEKLAFRASTTYLERYKTKYIQKLMQLLKVSSGKLASGHDEA